MCTVAVYVQCVQLQRTCNVYSYSVPAVFTIAVYLWWMQLQGTCDVYKCSVPAVCIDAAYLRWVHLQQNCTCGWYMYGCSVCVIMMCIAAAHLWCV